MTTPIETSTDPYLTRLIDKNINKCEKDYIRYRDLMAKFKSPSYILLKDNPIPKPVLSEFRSEKDTEDGYSLYFALYSNFTRNSYVSECYPNSDTHKKTIELYISLLQSRYLFIKYPEGHPTNVSSGLSQNSKQTPRRSLHGLYTRDNVSDMKTLKFFVYIYKLTV